MGEKPSHDVPAEDVDHDVEVEVREGYRASELGDVPRPDLVRCDCDELRLGVHRPHQLVAALTGSGARAQEPVHGAHRADVAILVEQDGMDLPRRQVHESRLDEQVPHLDPFRGQQCAWRSRSR